MKKWAYGNCLGPMSSHRTVARVTSVEIKHRIMYITGPLHVSVVEPFSDALCPSGNIIAALIPIIHQNFYAKVSLCDNLVYYNFTLFQ